MIVRITVLVTLIALLMPARDAVSAAQPLRQAGHASWYGHPYHGRRTANGETYDMHALTAASPTLPLGSRVEVTNLRNGRSVEVRVNDRMPHWSTRVIDLSHAAATRLRAVGAGVIPVSLRVKSIPSRAPGRAFHGGGFPPDQGDAGATD